MTIKPIEEMSAEEKQLIKAYQKVFMGSVEGQLVFWDLMDKGYVFRTFGQQNANAYALEGKRELALYILGAVELQPSLGRPGTLEMKKLIESIERVSKFKHKEETI